MREPDFVLMPVKDWDDDFCETLADFIDQLQGLLKKVPPEFRADTLIQFDRLGSDYDCSMGELSVFYNRAPTQQEIDDAAALEASYERERLRAERKQYELLKAKYDTAEQIHE